MIKNDQEKAEELQKKIEHDRAVNIGEGINKFIIDKGRQLNAERLRELQKHVVPYHNRGYEHK